MKNHFLVVLLALGLAFLESASAQTADAAQPAKPAPRPDPAFEIVTDVPGLPRVLLIGDSISIGYTLPVRTALKGRANVHRIPENGGPTPTGLKNLELWLGRSKWDVIHFNWGLHDLKYMENGRHQVPIESYEKNLVELVRRLKATGAKLIWCSTTPVPDAKVSPPRKNQDVIAFNAAARKVMEAERISIDDLYAHAWPELSRIQLPANVHYTKEGSEWLAKQVVRSIEAALPAK